jgi:hypothetical protein
MLYRPVLREASVYELSCSFRNRAEIEDDAEMNMPRPVGRQLKRYLWMWAFLSLLPPVRV